MLYKRSTEDKTVRMCITKKKCSRLLCFVLLSSALLVSKSQNASPAAGVQIEIKISVGEAAEQLSDALPTDASHRHCVRADRKRCMEWHDRTNRAVFTRQEPRRKGGMVSYEDRKSTWNSGVQSYDPSMVTALQHGTWMDEESFKKTHIWEKEKRGDIHQPFYGTWVADFMLRQDAGSFMLGKYLSDKKTPWRRRRRWGMAVAGNTPTASFLTEIGKMQSAGCRLCKIAREA